jgi:RNA polymerase I-specific transcription initiation factor RRN6
MPDDDSPLSIVISDLTACPNITLASGEDTTLPNLFAIYDDLANAWMTNLPPHVPGHTRVSMHKIIRQVAIELCLSSVGLALRPKEPEQPAPLDGHDEQGAVPSSPLYTPEMTPAAVSEPPVSMSLPPRTPSVYSHATNTTGSELGENPAITRLRQHAVSIGSQADPGKSKFLSSWVVGGNPAEYSWEATQKAADSGEEDDHRRRREEARRKRRTEKFLNRERARAPVAAESQPAFLPAGSQPDFAHNGFSSQTVDELPMTQPDRGAFGSRTATKGKKKGKRRKSGF